MTLDPAIADMERRWKASGIPGLYSGSGPDIGVGVYDQAEGTVDAALRRGALRVSACLAQRPVSTPGRSQGEYRSAQHEGTPVSPPGRPKGELTAVRSTVA